MTHQTPPHAASTASGSRLRAIPHILSLLIGALLLAVLPCGCGDPDSGPSPAQVPQLSPAHEIDALVKALTPLDPTLTSDFHDRALVKERALIERLEKANPEVGREALRRFRESQADPKAHQQVVRGFLRVAAHAAPEDTQPLLEELVLEYGHKIADRAQAVKLMSQIRPERAIELFEPLLLKKKQEKTMPDDEFFVSSYIKACRKAGHDPVPVLADVALNIFKQPVARYFSATELGNHPGQDSYSALYAVLVESTGDGMLRIKAAQAIRNSVSRERACELFHQVAGQEADLNYLKFLEDMIEAVCE